MGKKDIVADKLRRMNFINPPLLAGKPKFAADLLKSVNAHHVIAVKQIGDGTAFYVGKRKLLGRLKFNAYGRKPHFFIVDSRLVEKEDVPLSRLFL